MSTAGQPPPAGDSPYRRPRVCWADHAVELDAAITDMASLVAALHLGEPDRIVDGWNNRLWSGLRGLTREQLVEIVIVLLGPYGQHAAARLVDVDAP